MIEFKSLCSDDPYILLKEKYDIALKAGQQNIEAIAISSFDKKKMEVDSRFVNLKFIDGKKFIFFSNYNSPKSIAFQSHDQICALFYWSSVDIQIRLKAKIEKTKVEFNQEYFKKRSIDKNALAISSNQSQGIKSYEQVLLKYNEIKDTNDLKKCPDYWGGFSFIPYYFEFWEGRESRLNKRKVFKFTDDKWKSFILQP